MISSNDDSKIIISEDSAEIMEQLNEIGVLGLLIQETGGLPLVFRGYNSQGVVSDTNPFLITGFISALHGYAASISGFLTDIGLGFVRIAFKIKENLIYCIFLNEAINRRFTGEELAMTIELTLHKLIKTFEKLFSDVREKGRYNKVGFDKFKAQADQILLSSFLKSQELIFE
ncbi:MAG: hypothetical protein ACXAC7_18285 [Candidatus Hodarchaeales archaeon]